MIKRLFSICTLILTLGIISAQASNGPEPKKKKLPKIFVLGDFQTSYDELVVDYNQSLLDACDCSMEQAFAKWLSMLHELDVYSKKENIDIRGVKAWLHVFWNADGSIKNIAYHLRPNSKQIEAEKFNYLLEKFAQQYTFPTASSNGKGFSHYSTGAFPTFAELDQRD